MRATFADEERADAPLWLPEGFEPPVRLDLPPGHHLRPIREDDVAAVMGDSVGQASRGGGAPIGAGGRD